MVLNVVIVGAGGQGKETLFYISRINDSKKKFKVVGFVDDNSKLKGTTINGCKIIGNIDSLRDIEQKSIHCVLAIGNPKTKQAIANRIEKMGLPFVNIIDPSVIIDYETIEIGEGNIIAPGVKILPNVKIEDYVLVNYNSVIGHESVLETYSTIAPSVGIAGNVRIKKGVKVGIGANIIQNLTVGMWSVIGAGAAVIKDVPEKTLVVGVPGIVKKRLEDI